MSKAVGFEFIGRWATGAELQLDLNPGEIQAYGSNAGPTAQSCDEILTRCSVCFGKRQRRRTRRTATTSPEEGLQEEYDDHAQPGVVP